MESPWDEESGPDILRDVEWSRLSSQFTTTGYREGITAGKESALQEGFDTGFATVGAPIGREIGMLRGIISALLASLNSDRHASGESTSMLSEARSIASQLNRIRFSEIAPRDMEAEAHAREHLEIDEGVTEMEENNELAQKRQIESLEDMLARLTAGPNSSRSEPHEPSLTSEDVEILKNQTLSLCSTMGLNVHWN